MRPRAALILAAILLPTLRFASAELTPDERRRADRYAEILREDPAHVVARQRLWSLHATSGDAAALLADYASRATTSLPDALVHAYLLLQSGSPTAALAALATATANFPSDPAPLIAQAEILSTENQDAIPTLEAAQALAPDDPEIVARLIRARLAVGDTAAAEANRSADPSLRQEIAAQHLAANRPTEARSHLEWLVVNGDPEQRLAALRTLSEIAEKARDLPAAVDATSQALALLGFNHWLRPELEARLTNLRARAGSLPDHLADLRTRAKADPQDWRPWREIAHIERTLGRPSEQIDALSRALAAAPTDNALRRRLADAEADFGDLDRAIGLVDELIADTPNDADVQFLRAELDLRNDQPNEARRRVDSLVEADPTLRPRATSFYEANRLPAAARDLWTQAAAQGDPAASLKLASAQLSSGDLAAALETLGRGPAGPDFSLRAAALLRSYNQAARSIPFLESVDGLEASRQLAAALVATDQAAKAVTTLEAARVDHPSEAATLDRQIFDILAADPEGLRVHLATLTVDRQARWERWLEAAEPVDSNDAHPLVPDATVLDDLAVAAEKAPGSATALIELAAARQAAGDYFAALEAWTSAFALASASEKTALLAPILATAARLQLPDRGLGFLTDYAESRSGEADRTLAWLDAVAFAEKSGNLALLEATLAGAPDNYPTAVARAAIQTAQGNDDDAFATLEASSRLAADQPAALSRTLTAATRTGDQAVVIRSAARLTASGDTFPIWQQAASALEAAGATDPANATWDAIRRKFNRDPAALAAAAEHFESNGDREAHAEAIYAAALLDPTDPIPLAQAAILADRRGDRERAIAFNDQILAATDPLAPDPARFPGFDEVSAEATNAAHSLAMRAIGGLADTFSVAAVRATADRPTATGPAEARLTAIRDRARLSTGGSSRDQWLAWCAAARPFEAAWGFYAADEFKPAHSALLDVLATSNDPASAERALIWNALRRSSFATLRDWINSDPTVRRRRTELLFLGLSRLLATHTYEMASDQIETLFPRSAAAPQRDPAEKPSAEKEPADPGARHATVTNVERWRAAWLFAAHARLESALQLAADAGDFPSEQQIAETQIASWHLLLGHRDEALSALAPTASLPTDGLDSPAAAALRLQWLIMTPSERRSLLATIGSGNATRSALLAALDKNAETLDDRARQLVDEWKATSSGTAVGRSFSSLVRGAITQSHAWNLPDLALAIGEAAANSDALVASQSGDALAWRTDLAGLIAGSRLMLAAPRETTFVVDDLDSQHFDFQAWATLARRLDAAGYAAAALAVRDELLERHPDDPATINERAISAASSEDLSLQADLLERTLFSGRLGSNFPAIVSQTEQLAALRFELHEPAAALPYIDRVLDLAPADSRLVALKDEALRRLGDTDGRRKLWSHQTDLDPATGTLGRARFLIDVGEPNLAISALRALLKSRPANAAEIRILLFETEARHGDQKAALRELERLASTNQWDAVGRLAPAVAASGDPATASAVLRRGLTLAADPRVRFACGRILLELSDPSASLDSLQADIGRMRRAAEASPELIPELYEIGSKLASKSEPFSRWFVEQMRLEWNDGAGSTLAGQRLFDFDPPDLDTHLDQFLSDRHYDLEAWTAIAADLAQGGHARAAARVYRELATRAPNHPGFNFLEASQLWLAGDHSAAIRSIDPWISIRAFDPSIQRQAADFFRDIDRPARARQLYAEIVAEDVAVRHPEAWIELAKLTQRTGDFATAKLFLLAAFANPKASDWPAIAAFLIERGNLASLNPDENEFDLSPDLHDQVRLAVATSLVDQGSYRRALDWLKPSNLPNAEVAETLQDIAQRGDLFAKVSAFWGRAIAERHHSAELQSQFDAFQSFAAIIDLDADQDQKADTQRQ